MAMSALPAAAAVWLFRAAVFLLGIGAAELVKRLFRVLRRGTSLRRQFDGPPSKTFLLGAAPSARRMLRIPLPPFQGFGSDVSDLGCSG